MSKLLLVLGKKQMEINYFKIIRKIETLVKGQLASPDVRYENL